MKPNKMTHKINASGCITLIKSVLAIGIMLVLPTPISYAQAGGSQSSIPVSLRDPTGNFQQVINLDTPKPLTLPAIDIPSGLENESIRLHHTYLPGASWVSLFDGDPATEIDCNTNLLIIRLDFKKPIILDMIRLETTGARFRWALYQPKGENALDIIHATRLGGTSGDSDVGDLFCHLPRPVSTSALLLVIHCVESKKHLKLRDCELMQTTTVSKFTCTFGVKGASGVFPGWDIPVSLKATLPNGDCSLPNGAIIWRNDTPEIAVIEQGVVHVRSSGMAHFTIMDGGEKATFTLEVQKPLLPMHAQPLIPALATPAPQALWKVPFVVICYFPTQDGVNVDSDLTDVHLSLQDLYNRTLRFAIAYKAMIEEASRFHGYKDSAALPALGYSCVKYVTYFEDVPRNYWDGHAYYPDYAQIVGSIRFFVGVCLI